jgi:hypothetical protein
MKGFIKVMKAIKIIMLILVLLAVCGFAAQDSIRFEVAAIRGDYPTLVRIAAKRYGVPLELAIASYKVESRERRDSYRFEVGQMPLGRKVATELKIPEFEFENQAKMYASSHCPMQVMGYHAPKHKLSWLDLYKPANCVNIGMEEKKKCFEAASKEHAYAREIYRATERCYNGGNIHTKSEKAQKHALKVENEMIEEFFKTL